MALLEVRNIEAYYGAAVALRGVSLDVAQGTIVAVLGANGAGKTTLLKTITGALDPRAGSITFNGVEIQGRETWDVAAVGIAHVPEGREVFRHLNVEENLRMGAYRRNDSAEVERTSRRSMNTFRGFASAEASTPDCCRAASSRWWLLGARSWRAPALCFSTNRL